MEPIDTAEVHRLRRRCDFTAAYALLDPHLAGDAPDTGALVLAGRLDLDSAATGRALDRFTAAVAAAPGEPDAYPWRVAALDDLYRWDDAEEAAAEGVRLFPDDPQVWVALARLHDKRLRRADAIEAARRAVRVGPDDRIAAEWHIGILRFAYRYDEAERAARDAIRRMPQAADLHAELGNLLSDLGRYPEAVNAYADAMAAGGDRAEIPGLRAARLRWLGRYDEAGAVLEAAVERFPNAADPCLSLSDHVFTLGDEAEALRLCEEAVRREPADPEARRELAVTLSAMRRHEEAEAVLRAALAERPDEPRLMLPLAVVVSQLERDEDALALCDRALDVWPQSVGAMQERVDVLVELGRGDDARAAAAAYAGRFPDNVSVAWKHASVLQRQNRDAEALAVFDRAQELDPHSIAVRRGRSAALSYLNRDEEALAAIEESQALRPYDTEFGADRAVRLWELGRHDAALGQLGEVLRVDVHSETQQTRRVDWLRDLGRPTEAEAAARAAIEALPRCESLVVALAKAQRDRGHADAAVTTLNDAIERFGPGHLSYFGASLFGPLVELGRLEDARALAERITAACPDEENAWAWHVYVLRVSRRYAESERRAREFLARRPSAIDVLGELVGLYVDQDRFDDALERADEALALVPDHWGLWATKVRLLRFMHRYDDADAVARDGAARYPNSVVFPRELGWTLDWRGRHEEALASFAAALALDPRDVPAERARITMLVRLGRLDDAATAISAAMEVHAESRELLLRDLATVHDAAHRYDAAVRCLDQARELDPYDLSTAVEKANALRSARRPDEAERLLAPILEQHPLNQDVRAALGWTRRDQGRLAEATAAFERLRADAASPTEVALALHGLGWLDLDRRDPERARDRFREALTARPTSDNARQGLAWALVRGDDTAALPEAEELCLAILAQRPHDAESCVCLGVINFRLGRLAQAEYYLKRSLEMDPSNGSHVDLGALYVQLGRYDEAQERLDAALARDWYDLQAHIESGNLLLVRHREDGAGGAPVAAARHFRQALTIEPSSGAATIGLALALAQGGDGGLAAAENVLRRSLRGPCDHPAWQLRLTLARLLIQNGDATQRPEMYEDALTEAQAAIELKPDAPEPYFVAGVAEYKLGQGGADLPMRTLHRHRARVHLGRYRDLDPTDVEARRVLRLIEQDVRTARRSAYSSLTLAGISTALLVALWAAFLFTDRVTPAMMMTLTPVMIGLVALGLVLPLLIRLKLPGGVEADLAASLSQISSGPPGTPDPSGAAVGLGRGDISVSPGPSGAVGRRE